MNSGNWLDIATWGHAAGWTILHSLWQISLLALCARAVLRFVSPKHPELRYGLLLMGMLLAAVWVGLTFFRLQQDHPNTPAFEPDARMEASAAPRPAHLPAPAELSIWDYYRQKLDQLDRFMPFIANAWLAGILLYSLSLIFGLAYLKYLQFRKVTHPPPGLRSRFAELCRQMRVKTRVGLLLSEIAQEPLTFRFFRPVILLPASLLTGLSPDQVEVLLLHELAHIRRHDFTVNLLQVLIEVLLFYHPAIWWLSARIREEREHCCDDAVLAVRNQPALYAKALTRIQLHQSLIKNALAMSATGNQSTLTKRVYRLFGRYDQPTSRYRSMAILMLLLLIGFSAQSFLSSKQASRPETVSMQEVPVAAPPMINKAALVTGRVDDENGNPLIGASVLIKGTTTGTVTDLEGAFELQLGTECASLVISYVGMQSRELPSVCAGQRWVVALEKAVEKPQEKEVVVTGKPAPAPAATPSPVNTASLVSGKVFDENSNPLIGASILIKGSTVGTITDFHGEFQLQLSDECETLIVSYIGMKTRELPNSCGGQKLDVAMEKAVLNALPEEVTVVGKPSPAVVDGIVIGEGGKPLPGALVLIKDSKIGTVTDMEGAFRLELPEKCATLIFRYVGMVERMLEEVCGGRMAVLLNPVEKAEGNNQSIPTADPAIATFEVYPNPSQGEVNVTFRLEKPGRVKLNVITIDGKLVEKLADQQLDAGPQQFRWQADPGAKGTFMLLLETESGFSRKQVVVE